MHSNTARAMNFTAGLLDDESVCQIGPFMLMEPPAAEAVSGDVFCGSMFPQISLIWQF